MAPAGSLFDGIPHCLGAVASGRGNDVRKAVTSDKSDKRHRWKAQELGRSLLCSSLVTGRGATYGLVYGSSQSDELGWQRHPAYHGWIRLLSFAVVCFSKGRDYHHWMYGGFMSLMASGLLRMMETFTSQLTWSNPDLYWNSLLNLTNWVANVVLPAPTGPCR